MSVVGMDKEHEHKWSEWAPMRNIGVPPYTPVTGAKCRYCRICDETEIEGTPVELPWGYAPKPLWLVALELALVGLLVYYVFA
mgnify:CR=1 FL=1|jgi:hypothetical protein